MATRRPTKSGKWEYTIRNKRYLPKPYHFTADTKEIGDAYAAQMESQLARGIVHPSLLSRKTKPLTISEALRDYRKVVAICASDEPLLDRIERALGPIEIGQLDYPWAESWVTDMKRRQHLAPTTIRHYVGAFGRALDWLVRHNSPDLVKGNPLRLFADGYATYTKEDIALAGVKKTNVERNRRLEPREEKAIRAVLAGERPKNRQRPLVLRHAAALRLLFTLALETCMRMREMFTLEVRQVSLAKRTVFLEKTKNGDRREVPLTKVAMNVIADYLAQNQESARADARLFPWWDGRSESMNATTALLSAQFGRIFAAADCADLRFHDLRHEATSRLYENTNFRDMEIAQITGHKNLRMLQRYSNLRGSQLALRMD
jgi:integrase